MGESSSHLRRSRGEMKNNDGDNSNKAKRKKTMTEATKDDVTEEQRRMPLSDVVADCAERWFRATLDAAKIGDVSMQVLVSQMYYNGYGVPKDAKKGKFWITRASRKRSSVWNVRKKRPGYNASDSDSDESDGDSDSDESDGDTDSDESDGDSDADDSDCDS